MRQWLKLAAFAVATVLLAFGLLNASWLAPSPAGGAKLIAHRGAAQQFDRAGVTNDTCTASRIEPPVHDYLENTVRGVLVARSQGADMVEVDVVPTADGRIALFHDWTLDCRTDGSGEVRRKTLAELQKLDIGHGYTADGGRTYPFRGRTLDTIPALEEALKTLARSPFMFNFKSNDPEEADQLAAALKGAGRDVEKIGDAFYGAQGPVSRIRQHYPSAWAWTVEEARRCTSDYFMTGWTSVVPESCRGGTMVIPLNYQWLAWGWPNRLLARMEKAGARVIVTGPYEEGEPNTGLTLPEQLGEIPSSFNGYVWVEDIWAIGPALRPNSDIRTRAQQDATDLALERRRQRDR